MLHSFSRLASSCLSEVCWHHLGLGAAPDKVPPNNSFKPSPLRGLGAGAKIVPTPRPLSGPA